MTTTTFDPAAFKATTRTQWQAAAEAWHRWGPFLGDWLGDATETMLDLARVQTGSRVLDVAAGAGEQSLRAARRVGDSGRVLATDIAPNLLELAAADAAAEGLGQVETLEIDGEALHTLPADSFDAAVSRVGLIYFPDQQQALSGMIHALRPGGRVSVVSYSTPERNAFFSIPVRIIRSRAQLPPPLPGQPGPFSLGADGVLAQTPDEGRPARRRGRRGAVAGTVAEHGRVRAVRARVVRCPAPDDVVALGGGAGPDLAADRGGTGAVRGRVRLRGTVRDAGRSGHPLTLPAPLPAWSNRS